MGIEPTTKGIMSRFRCVLTSDEINSELVLFLNACSSHVDLSAIFQPVRRTKWRTTRCKRNYYPQRLSTASDFATVSLVASNPTTRIMRNTSLSDEGKPTRRSRRFDRAL